MPRSGIASVTALWHTHPVQACGTNKQPFRAPRVAICVGPIDHSDWGRSAGHFCYQERQGEFACHFSELWRIQFPGTTAARFFTFSSTLFYLHLHPTPFSARVCGESSCESERTLNELACLLCGLARAPRVFSCTGQQGPRRGASSRFVLCYWQEALVSGSPSLRIGFSYRIPEMNAAFAVRQACTPSRAHGRCTNEQV